ncbi:PTS lactose transporter subunit IIB [Fusobacterium necrophorum subsp. funduliforme]|uniref:PTS system, lactose/cellobiose-specific IIB subunit n=4 Tax=Fusobacterium necrophorum TaxID=859 RepID=A0AAN4ATV5_9FUSO|nr:PTS sugar transporter subunit IIB [Fusobacterium necrophorum]AVQ22011.1 PTS lactose transporter subunit IIB [Fusobacterium necrophorum subsp. funduliforme]AYV95627.1 PTS lactose transporter subunit IIB [Fusobacterium necrophorum subsp. funduliforme]AYZ73964.1 PTS lactose transporter subunit IIB [Fusobacterium necrophorum]AZW10158.1 PTS lactose transporter subunit IIB [Fusobacterium necrophorum subsp. necrophorum]EFS23884.1 PTS system, Lactose/Cellobiose specific IIB subunit [Fusobacterium n
MGLFNKFLKKSELKNLEEKNLKEYQKMIPEKKYRGIIACGSGIATSTMVRNKIEKAFREREIDLEIFQCKIGELEGKAKILKPDFVVHTVILPKGQKFSCPVFSGVSLLTGVGGEKLLEDIIKTIVNNVK